MKKRLPLRTLITLIIVVVLVPLTVWAGLQFGQKSYYVTSVLIILYTMIPFFIAFEKRRPDAKELVMIAVLSAIAVASRAIFIALPQVKPMTAVIMIAGAALGAEAGFLTGAVTAFASNFIFGQGPWTPWQMFAFGMAGFLTGLIFRKWDLGKKRIAFAVYGVLMVMLVIGPLLDTSSLFMFASSLSWGAVGAVYIGGLAMNAIHAAATGVTLFLAAKPMIERIERVRLKYGMVK